MPTWLPLCRTLNVTIPSSTLKNGSLYTQVFLGPLGLSPSNQGDRVQLSWSAVPLTKYAIPQSTAFNLLGSSDQVKIHLLSLSYCSFSLRGWKK